MRNDDALTAEEVATMLQVSKSMVYKLVKSDELASYYVGRKMRFSVADVENYISRSKHVSVRREKRVPATHDARTGRMTVSGTLAPLRPAVAHASLDELVIAGNDIIGDVLANYLGSLDIPVARLYEGSYAALADIYLGRAQIAFSHIYDAETDTYNVEAVKQLLPGMPVVVLRLAARRQGFIVARETRSGYGISRTWPARACGWSTGKGDAARVSCSTPTFSSSA